MNHGEARGSGGRRGSRGRSPASDHISQKSGNWVPVDRSSGESSGSRGRGFRGGRRSSPSRSPGNGPAQVFVKKPSQASNVGSVEKGVQQERMSQEDNVGSTKQPDEVAALKFSEHNQNDLQSSAPSSSSVPRECEDVKDGASMSCDLVSRMEDVSLSGGVAVPSTSDKKVELSSVEDHETAHKSGDVGKASNESNTRPFDLCLEKKGMGLKPSIFELNKEKRRATKGYTGVVIRPGMVHLRNYLSINDQVMIVKKCRELGLGEGGFYQPGYRDGASLHLKMMCLGKNWDPQTSRYGETRPFDGSVPPKIPVEFRQLVAKAIKDSQSIAATNSKQTKGELEIPFMSPDICIANFYTSTGRLGLHQDKDESEKSIENGLPVVSFSIGDSAEFVFSDQRNDDKTETVVLKSGDVLLFGGKSRKVFHGVRSILKDTAPTVLVQETSLRQGRLNLTFRQY